MVTPRASERVEMEAKKESDSGMFSTHLPIQVSGAFTMTNGLLLMMAKNEGPVSLDREASKKYAALTGLGVGAGWLATTILLSQYYNPYGSANKERSGMPKGSSREQLARERMAEESIDRAAAIGRRLTWLSVISQAGTSAYMTINAPKSSLVQMTSAASIVVALAPLIFKYRWQRVANEQEDYKKKIYGPVASLGYFNIPSGPQQTSLLPGLLVSWRY